MIDIEGGVSALVWVLVVALTGSGNFVGVSSIEPRLMHCECVVSGRTCQTNTDKSGFRFHAIGILLVRSSKINYCQISENFLSS